MKKKELIGLFPAVEPVLNRARNARSEAIRHRCRLYHALAAELFAVVPVSYHEAAVRILARELNI